MLRWNLKGMGVLERIFTTSLDFSCHQEKKKTLPYIFFTTIKQSIFSNKANCQISRFGRVVKATDLKSVGFARAGSNPAADVFLSCYRKTEEIERVLRFRDLWFSSLTLIHIIHIIMYMYVSDSVCLSSSSEGDDWLMINDCPLWDCARIWSNE